MKDTIIENHAALIESFEQSEFAKSVFSQLNKEFAKIGILIEFNDDDLLTFQKFKKRLTEEIELIMRTSHNSNSQLLYVIHLPKQSVNDIFNHATEPIESLSEMLINSHAQKVYFHKKYKLGLL